VSNRKWGSVNWEGALQQKGMKQVFGVSCKIWKNSILQEHED
jgi:hypothetical protein